MNARCGDGPAFPSSPSVGQELVICRLSSVHCRHPAFGYQGLPSFLGKHIAEQRTLFDGVVEGDVGMGVRVDPTVR